MRGEKEFINVPTSGTFSGRRLKVNAKTVFVLSFTALTIETVR